jgi:carboxynorspermidine decarboxylase
MTAVCSEARPVSVTRVPRASRTAPAGLRAEAVARVVAAVETPALVIDEAAIVRALEAAASLRSRCGCKVLYALKPLVCPFVLELMRPWVDGFATSSLFESRLARSVLGERGLVQITTPGFRTAEIEELDALCDRFSFNSLNQYSRFGARIGSPRKVGLRLNPEFPLVADARYNPCRADSKLGVSLERLLRRLTRSQAKPERLHGLHFHTNCDSADWGPLLDTVRHIESRLAQRLAELDWINLGGGYLLGPEARTEPLIEAVERLRDRYGVDVVIEPGAAFVREAGSLVCEVIDLFRSGRKTVAVLDTTVNHIPEVFEYQFEPDVLGHDDDGDYDYLLVGSSCLAGDVLGEYAFAEPLGVGSRVVLPNLGAYALVKAHMFNGINLPSIYSVRAGGELVLRRRFHYGDFLARTGAPDDAAF